MEKYVIIEGMAERKPKLFVVDDEPDHCLAIQSYFSRRNFLVSSASIGEEAVSQLKKEKPDLLLLDMKLSGRMRGKAV